MAEKLTTATNIQIQQKTDSGMVAYHPETNANVVKNTSDLTGETVGDVLSNALGLVSEDGTVKISLSSDEASVNLSVPSQLPEGGTAGQVLVSQGSSATAKWGNPTIITTGTDSYNIASTVGGSTTVSFYNTTQVDNKVSKAISGLDKNDAAVSNQYVTAVSETDGIISVSRKQIQYSEIANTPAATITLTPGTGDHTFKVNETSAKTVYVDTYSRSEIDQKITSQTKYLGSVASATELAALTPDSVGDFARASATFTYNSQTVHAGDLLICETLSPVSWSIVHTESDTWVPNTKDSDGYVTKGSGQANQVWKTDANGNPAWRDDENTTYNLVNKTVNGLVPNLTDYSTSTRIPSSNYVLSMTTNGEPAWAYLPVNAYNDTTYTAGAGLILSGTKFTPSLQSSSAATVAAQTQSAPTANTQLYPVRLDSNNQLSVYVPWQNTTYSASFDIQVGGTTVTSYTPSSSTALNFLAGEGIRLTYNSSTNPKLITITNNTTIKSGYKADGTTTITGTYQELGDSGIASGIYSAIQVNKKGIAVAAAQIINYYSSSETIGSELATGGFALIQI